MIIRFTGYILIPAVFLGSLAAAGWKDFNLTGLLQIREYTFLSHAVCMLIYLWMLFLILRISPGTDRRLLRLLHITAAASVFLPWSQQEQIISNLHIIAAYAAFILLNLITVPLIMRNHTCMRICILTMLFCLLHCMTYSSVTGPAEAAYACMLSGVLTYLSTK